MSFSLTSSRIEVDVSFLQKLRRAIHDHDLLSMGELTLVAVSGGVDSLVLLHALKELGYPLHVATLDHRLRGDAGAADADFVEAVAREWNIPCSRGSADVQALATERKISIEHAARIARYDFLALVARSIGANKVAVAHHTDDQAETVLLHLVRGSGLSGLAGMAWVAPLPDQPDLRVIRPLLGIRRAEIEAYAEAYDLHPREDATNLESTYTRNKIRLEVLPLLRQINPDVDSALNRLADNTSVDDFYLNQKLMDILIGQVTISSSRLILHATLFRDMPQALQRRFVLWSAEQLRARQPASDVMPVSYERTLAAVKMALNSNVGAITELGGNLRLRLGYEQVIVEVADTVEEAPVDTPLMPPETVIPMAVPGETVFEGWKLRIARDAETGVTANRVVLIPQGSSVAIRTRQTGDQFRIRLQDGKVGTKLLSRWMVDVKIPQSLRARVPLLVIDGQIAGVIWRQIRLDPSFTALVDDASDIMYDIILSRR